MAGASPAQRRVLVTGGCGFVGVNLTRALVTAGWEVAVYDDLSTGTCEAAEAAGCSTIIEGDVRDADRLRDAARGIDAIIHLAAHTNVVESVADPTFDVSVNVLGTLNALLAARDADASSFVLASSAAPLGEIDPPGHEGVVPRPLSPYGASKLAGEGLCSAFAGSYGLATVALRFTNLYGPRCGHKGSVVAAFMKRVMADEPLVVYGDGTQTRDFLYVDDLNGALLAAIERPPAGELIQLGTGVETSINELVEQITAVFPDRAVRVVREPPRAGEIQRSWSDITKARELLGYAPRTKLADGLAAVRDWFVEQT